MSRGRSLAIGLIGPVALSLSLLLPGPAHGQTQSWVRKQTEPPGSSLLARAAQHLLDNLLFAAARQSFDRVLEWWNKPASGTLEVNRDDVDAWEMFEIHKGRNGTVVLKFHTGYLSAEYGGGGSVIADRKAAGDWEHWTIRGNPDGTKTLVTANGHYLCAEGGGGQGLVANRRAAGPWERFSLIMCGVTPAGREVYALKAANGKFVSAQP